MTSTGVVDLGIEPEVKEILDSHEQTLADHSEKIHKMQLDNAGIKEKLNSVEGIVARFETNYYQTSNSIMQTMSQLVVNTSAQNTEITKVKIDNKTKVILKVLGIFALLITGILIGNGIDVSAIAGLF